MRREISTPPSRQSSPTTRRWRLFGLNILQKEWTRVRRENAQMIEEDLSRRFRDAWHGNFSEAHRWSMLVSQRIFKRCWMRRPLIDVILSRSAVLMLLVGPKPCNDVGSLRSHCCALTALETTMQRHVRRCLAGFPRNDLRGLVLTSGHCSSEQFDTLQSSIETDFSTVFRVCCSSLAWWWSHLLGMACNVHRLVVCRAA